MRYSTFVVDETILKAAIICMPMIAFRLGSDQFAYIAYGSNNFFLKSVYVCMYIYISQRCQSFRDFKTENKLQIIIEENFGDYWSQSLVQPLTTLHQLELISKDERK